MRAIRMKHEIQWWKMAYISPVPLLSVQQLPPSYQYSQGRRSHMPVDLINPLVADRAWRDDQSCSCGNWLHCYKAMGAVKRLYLQILLFIVHTLSMLPQVAIQALYTCLIVNKTKLTTNAFKAVIRSVEWEERGGMLYKSANMLIRDWGLVS